MITGRGRDRHAVALAVVCLALAACAPSRIAANVLTRPLRLPQLTQPGRAHRAVAITTAKGFTLNGWLLEPLGPARGLVVLLHGKDANRMHFMAQAEPLVAEGFAVLAYDSRAHGTSEGTFCTYGAKEVDDLSRALAQVPIRPVVLIGESMGAAVALQAAAQRLPIEAVVAAATFIDLRTIATLHAPAVLGEAGKEEALALAEAEADFRIDDISPLKAAAHVTVPVLLLHGSADTFTPLAHSYQLEAALGGPKHLVQLDGVGHPDVLLHAEAWRAIGRWLDRVVPRPSK